MIYIVFSSQEYDLANHKMLWEAMSHKNKIIVVDMSADLVVSIIKKKFYRLKQAFQRPRTINKNLFVFRPFFLIRPELMPEIFDEIIIKLFLRQIKNSFGKFETAEIRVLSYSAQWIKRIKRSNLKCKVGYYLFDEVARDAKTDKVDKKRYKNDKFACKNSDVVFAMSYGLAESRSKYNDEIIVIGNGATLPDDFRKHENKFDNSVAYIGNIRNWIDTELVERIIKSRDNLNFYFIGPIEKDMVSFIGRITTVYKNVFYLGQKDKSDIYQEFTKYDCIFVPYKRNEFMRNTRPIKIVESVMAGTPVVSVPVTGYKEKPFIRFAETSDQFLEQIDALMKTKIDIESVEYIDFIKENTWTAKAELINDYEW